VRIDVVPPVNKAKTLIANSVNRSATIANRDIDIFRQNPSTKKSSLGGIEVLRR
jgi:hypothetical protein